MRALKSISPGGRAFGLLLLVSCSNTEFTGDTWRSSRVTYHARVGDPQACPEVLPVIEQRSDLFGRLVDVPAAIWEPIEYFKAIDEADYQAITPCPAPSYGCMHGRTIYSPEAVSEHEIAHVAYAALGGEGPPFLEEGFAVSLTCQPSEWRTTLDRAPLEEALDTGGGWAAPSHLVTALWSAGVPSDFFELEGSFGAAVPSVEELAREVQRIYGRDLHELWASARSKAGLECVAHPFCSAPELDLGETILRHSCTGRESRTLSSELAPALGVRVAGAPALIRACSTDVAPDPIQRGVLGAVFEFAWRTETWFRAPREPHAIFPDFGLYPGESSLLSVRDLSGAFAGSCDATVATPVRADTDVSLVVPYEADSYFFPLRLEQALPVGLRWFGVEGANIRVRLCDGCPDAEAANCTEPDLSTTTAETELRDGTVLVLAVEQELQSPNVLRLEPYAP